MSKNDPDFLKRARTVFTDNPGKSLQDIRNQLATGPVSTGRRDALSGLDAVANLFKRPLASIPARWQVVRPLFASKEAAQLGLSVKRYANIRSAVLGAMKDHGVQSATLTTYLVRSSEWSDLLANIETPDYRSALNRFACFCSALGIAPKKVSSEVLPGFYEALVASEVAKDPRAILHNTISYWNMCAKRIADWPKIRLGSPFPSNQIVLPLSAFPASFDTDLAKWGDRSAVTDVLDPQAPTKALRAVTVQHQTKRLLRFASLLVRNDTIAIEGVVDLAAILAPDVAKAGLTIMLKKAQGQPTPYIALTARLLASVARHYCALPPAVCESLSNMARRLSKKREKGMTARNQERLQQFDNPEAFRKLRAYPNEIRALGLKMPNKHRQALCFERALVAQIFLYSALRMENLKNIRLDTTIKFEKGECHLRFIDSEMKNSDPFTAVLPASVAASLKEFIQIYRPRLKGSAGPYLFPGKNGGPRHHSTIRLTFEKGILKHTGLEVHPHFIRHLTSKVALSENPQLLFAVSKRLGHKSIQTTIDSYLENQSLTSSRLINGILEESINKPKDSDKPKKARGTKRVSYPKKRRRK